MSTGQTRQRRTASITVEPPTSDAAQCCLTAYYRELAQRFEHGFDVAQSLPADSGEFCPPGGVFLIARLDGQACGCGGFKTDTPEVAYVKRMWVAESARGLGLGRQLLRALEDHARDHGFQTIRLETNRTLQQAIAMYRQHGYSEVAPFNDEPYAHHWFERTL